MDWNSIIIGSISFILGSGVSTYTTLRMLRANIAKTNAEADSSVAESARSLAGAADTIVELYNSHFEKELGRLRDEVGTLRITTQKQELLIAEQTHQINLLSSRLSDQERQYSYLLTGAKILAKQVRQLGAEPLFDIQTD